MSTTINLQNPDPTAQISGFYGPGMFAAWVITLITSWIRIFQNNYDSNFHFIAYNLYTFWVAMDSTEYVNPTECDKLIRGVSPDDSGLAQRFAVRGAVVFTGYVHVVLQLCICCWKYSGLAFGPDVERKLSIRICILYLGTMFPLGGIGQPVAGFVDLLTMFLLIVCFLCVFFPCIFLIYASQGEFSFPYYLLVVFIYFLTFSSYLFLIVRVHVETVQILRGEPAPYFDSGKLIDILFHDKCTYMPCAPQKIGEWDQSFSLFFALYFFLYEFLGSILRFPSTVFKSLLKLISSLVNLAVRVPNLLCELYTSIARVSRRTDESQVERYFHMV